MKRIIALIMALALVMGLAITASAASITITPSDTQTGNMADVTYTAVKLFDAEIIDGGVTYSLPAPGSASYNDFVAKVLENVDRPKKDTDQLYFTKTLSADGSKYYIVPTDLVTNNNARELASHLIYSTGWTNFGTEIPYDADSGNFFVNNLAPGYYFIHSNTGTNALVQTLGDVEIKNKNEYPTIEKKVNGQDSVTVDEGNEVTFTVTIEIPDQDYSSSAYMTLHDTCEGVTIDPASVTATWADGTPVGSKLNTAKCDDHALDVTFDFNTFGSGAGTITVTYTGTVNALTADATNTAWITLHPNYDPDEYYESVKDTVTMSNAKIDIFKYTPGAENVKNPLADAGFVLAKKDEQGVITGYYQFEDGVVDWVDDIAQATEHKSGADGKVPAFEGLAEGTYYIVEKTVPAGYNKAADKPITIGTVANEAGIQVADDMSAEVENNTGSQLPSTGGIGTTLFYVIGGLMMTGAAVLLITKKRMAA